MSVAFVEGLLRFDVGSQLVSVVSLEEVADGGVGELAVEGVFAVLFAVLDLSMRIVWRENTRKRVGVLSTETPK